MPNDWNHLLMDIMWLAAGIGAMYILHKMLMPHGNATGFFLSAEAIAIAVIIGPYAKHEIDFRRAGPVADHVRPGMTLEGLLYVFLALIGSLLVVRIYKWLFP